MVASGTSCLGVDLAFVSELDAEILRRFYAEVRVVGKIGLRVVAEIIDFLERTEVLFRRPVALQAPAH